MRKTGNLRRLVSGFLAGMTLLSTALSPMTAYAAESKAEENPPLYEEVKDLLDEDEVVKAKDYEITVGSEFDVTCDFTGLEIKDDKKVKVTFEEAKNEEGKDFALDHADSYKAVYYVEPVNEAHPKYQISRNLIVKEAETEVQAASEGGGEDAGSGGTEEAADDGEADSQTLSEEESETAETEMVMETEVATEPVTEAESEMETETVESSEVLPEEELDAALEESLEQETVDPETGLSVSDVLEQGEEQGIDMLSLEEGETVQFQAQALFASARSTTSVSVTRGAYYYYADYGLGSYLTAPYTVKFGDVTATAYCVQPSKPGPGDGTYTITKLSDGKTLAKVCYYGTKASGDEGFFAEKHPDFSTGKRFIITHLAAAYANGSSDAFSGTNATGKSLAMELYNYCVSQPEIPDVAMSFSNAKVKAYIDGNSQRTEEITFKADVLQTITMKLPSGVKFHNVSTGKTSAAGASVEVSGGTKFYLSAPLTQAEDVSGSWSVTMKGSITKDCPLLQAARHQL